MAALPLAGQSRAVSDAPITLYTKFQVDPPKLVPKAMQEELASIFTPAGLRFHWRSLEHIAPGEVSAELVIINFQGRCMTESPRNYGSKIGPLGWTHMEDHEVLPFSDVDCDRLSAFLRPVLAALPPMEAEVALGRAMARVLAHELYHVFARTTHHGSAGVARTGYSVYELTAETFVFEEADVRVLSVLRERNRFLDRRDSVDEGRFLYSAGGCANCHGVKGQGTLQAPSLRAGTLRLTLSRLASRLTGRSSQMQRRARSFASLWRAFGDADIESLLSYLSTAAD
jgi:cytochrome c553